MHSYLNRRAHGYVLVIIGILLEVFPAAPRHSAFKLQLCVKLLSTLVCANARAWPQAWSHFLAYAMARQAYTTTCFPCKGSCEGSLIRYDDRV